jgi:hypothetical protein
VGAKKRGEFGKRIRFVNMEKIGIRLIYSLKFCL